MALTALHSLIHRSDDKITSLTVSFAPDTLILTLSDKINKVRVKLDESEIAGLAAAIERNANWSAFHSFKALSGEETRSRINYANDFFSVDSNTKRIALKLAQDEKSSLALALRFAFNKMLEAKLSKT
jgi:hypothetical protein